MNLGFSGEILFILLLALVLFGPRKLPEIARQAGRFMAEFRKASSQFQSQINAEIAQLEQIVPANDAAPALAEAKLALDDTSLSGTLNRLTERIANFASPDPALERKEPAKTADGIQV